jgi:hypothetical protein
MSHIGTKQHGHGWGDGLWVRMVTGMAYDGMVLCMLIFKSDWDLVFC